MISELASVRGVLSVNIVDPNEPSDSFRSKLLENYFENAGEGGYFLGVRGDCIGSG